MPPENSLPQAEESGPARGLSKRAARRLIQRALVLMGRDKHVRQHIREAEIISLWTLEDWDFAWTVIIDHGKIEFERRPAKKPDLTLLWKTAEGFLKQVESCTIPGDGVEFGGREDLRRFREDFLKWFLHSLRHVMQSPVDDVGESLL